MFCENKKVDFSMAILVWQENHHLVPYLRPIMTPFFVEKGFQKHQEVSFFFSSIFFQKKHILKEWEY